MATYLSGKKGRALIGSCIQEVTFWELRYGADPQPFFPASQAPAQAAVAGPESGTGTFRIALDKDSPPDSGGTGAGSFKTGDEVDLELIHDEASDLKASGKAIIGEIQSQADLSGPVQELTYSFTTSNRWTLP